MTLILLQVRFSEGLNVSADAASRLFIYIGATTFIGRLLSGLLCNMRCVNPVYVYMGGLILDGCDIIFLTQAKTYRHLVAFSFLFGLADGVLVGAFYIQILMSVGPSLKASAMGLSALCYGTTIATGPALAGRYQFKVETDQATEVTESVIPQFKCYNTVMTSYDSHYI